MHVPNRKAYGAQVLADEESLSLRLPIPKQLFALPGGVRISAGFVWKAGADKGRFRWEKEQSDTAPTQQPALSRLSLPPIWVPKRLAFAQAHKKGFPASTCMSLTFCAWAFARFFSLGEHDPSQSHLRNCQRAPIGMRQKGFPLFAGATPAATPSQGGMKPADRSLGSAPRWACFQREKVSRGFPSAEIPAEAQK
ncbi:hypothetical protein Anapl_05662 [Anas platyrhynchos]|uniref:Uncharacterized protein n=1 Tax=Anas platyrhynchos TaxID=8839 RepID=R0L308_ANAPL|nr:hypothetical protein Anapl_05662 [Anas platyrhynchos]